MLMKKLITMGVLVVLAGAVRAQTWGEWFQQKKTQKKYLLQQIAALQLYLGYVRQGYSIARQGLTTISDFKNGELKLHQGYFQSLGSVNPNVQRYARMADQLVLQQCIRTACRSLLRSANHSSWLLADEKRQAQKVTAQLLTRTDEAIAELQTLATNGRLNLKDDERLRRIEQVQQELVSHYVFCRQLAAELDLLALQRQKADKDQQTLRQLNEP